METSTLNLDALIEATIVIEGGWNDDNADRGGPTNWGITLPKFRDYTGRKDATAEDLRALTRAAAADIYRHIFEKEMGIGAQGAAADPKLQGLLFDCIVNHGQGLAIEFLQQAVHVRVDGFIGPQTRAALAVADPHKIYRGVLAARIEKYGRIVSHDPTQAKWISGWNNRAAQFVREAP